MCSLKKGSMKVYSYSKTHEVGAVAGREISVLSTWSRSLNCKSTLGHEGSSLQHTASLDFCVETWEERGKVVEELKPSGVWLHMFLRILRSARLSQTWHLVFHQGVCRMGGRLVYLPLVVTHWSSSQLERGMGRADQLPLLLKGQKLKGQKFTFGCGKAFVCGPRDEPGWGPRLTWGACGRRLRLGGVQAGSCSGRPETSAPPRTPPSPLVLSCSEDTWQEYHSAIQHAARLPSGVWLLAQSAEGDSVFPSEYLSFQDDSILTQVGEC